MTKTGGHGSAQISKPGGPTKFTANVNSQIGKCNNVESRERPAYSIRYQLPLLRR